MRAIDGKSFTNISATTAVFQLDGGIYGADIIATWAAGSVTLEKLSADGSTYVSCGAFSANGYSAVQLPQGTYRFAVATASAVYINIRRIPAD